MNATTTKAVNKPSSARTKNSGTIAHVTPRKRWRKAIGLQRYADAKRKGRVETATFEHNWPGTDIPMHSQRIRCIARADWDQVRRRMKPEDCHRVAFFETVVVVVGGMREPDRKESPEEMARLRATLRARNA